MPAEPTKLCERCERPLLKGKRFCSKACWRATTAADASAARRKCERCGSPVKTRGRVIRFCSAACAAKASRGRVTPMEVRLRIAESNRKTRAAPPDEKRECLCCGETFMCRPQTHQRLCSVDCRDKMPRAPRTAESRKRLSEKYKGPGNPYWKGGATPANQRDRNAPGYREWRQAVYARDGYRCQDCGVVGCRAVPLNAHHIQAWKDHPDVRFDVGNGVTVCVPCHRSRHRPVERVAALLGVSGRG